MSKFLNTNLITVVFFAIAAIGAGTHVISQKKLIDKMDSANMNFSVFLLSTMVTVVPVPFTFKYSGNFSMIALFSLIALGFITGISFYIYAKVLKKVSLLVAALVGNTSVLFTLLWAWLFFREPINNVIIIGAIIFVFGIILLSLPVKAKESIIVSE